MKKGSNPPPPKNARPKPPLDHKAHYLPGRGRRSGHQGAVTAIHAVGECHGDNFNSSLCGKSPGRLSMGWQLITRQEVNCEKCLAELEKMKS